jgi:hypothetical protein
MSSDETIEIAIEEYEELKAKASLIEIRGDSIENPPLEDIHLAGHPVGKLLSKALQNSSEAKKKSSEAKDKTESHEQAIKHLNATKEAGFSDATPEGSNGETATQNAGLHQITPLEKLAQADDDDHPFPGGKPGPSVERAVEIYEHFRQWSGRKVMAGWTITEGLKKLLSTATGERLAWKQVYRACKKLETWTNGEIEFRKTDRHGWFLVTTNQRLVQKHSSSANGA